MKPERLIFPDLDYPVETLHHHKNRYMFVRRMLQENDRVVDIGCGTGYGCNIMKNQDKNIHVTGIDKSKKAIRYAQKHYKNISFFNMDADDILLNTSNADVITMFEFIEHIPEHMGMRLLGRICGCCRYLFLSTPCDAELGINPFHMSEWDEDDLRGMLSGFFDRVLFFGQDWASGQIVFPYSKRCSFLFVVCINEKYRKNVEGVVKYV